MVPGYVGEVKDKLKEARKLAHKGDYNAAIPLFDQAIRELKAWQREPQDALAVQLSQAALPAIEAELQHAEELRNSEQQTPATPLANADGQQMGQAIRAADPDVWPPPTPAPTDALFDRNLPARQFENKVVDRRQLNGRPAARTPPRRPEPRVNHRRRESESDSNAQRNGRDRESIGQRRRATASNPKRQSVGTAGGGPKYDMHGRRIDPPALKARGQTDDANGSDEKRKYSEMPREDGLQPLVASIEQEIVEQNLNVKFDSIAGHEAAKQALKEAVYLPSTLPEYFVGIREPAKGVLLFGPPGTGKTMLAKAVASEYKITFFNVSASTFASKFRGESEKMVKILFEMARYYAPSVIFVDEIDSIGTERGGGNEHEASRRVKTELLTQMDGISADEEPGKRVLVLAATNHPWDLDEALRRRFENRIYVPLPDTDGRKEVFRLCLQTIQPTDDLNLDELADATEGYSASDIKSVCRAASKINLRRVMASVEKLGLAPEEMRRLLVEEKREELNAAITTEDLKAVLSNVKKSVSADSLQRYADWEAEFRAD